MTGPFKKKSAKIICALSTKREHWVENLLCDENSKAYFSIRALINVHCKCKAYVFSTISGFTRTITHPRCKRLLFPFPNLFLSEGSRGSLSTPEAGLLLNAVMWWDISHSNWLRFWHCIFSNISLSKSSNRKKVSQNYLQKCARHGQT